MKVIIDYQDEMFKAYSVQDGLYTFIHKNAYCKELCRLLKREWGWTYEDIELSDLAKNAADEELELNDEFLWLE